MCKDKATPARFPDDELSIIQLRSIQNTQLSETYNVAHRRLVSTNKRYCEYHVVLRRVRGNHIASFWSPLFSVRIFQSLAIEPSSMTQHLISESSPCSLKVGAQTPSGVALRRLPLVVSVSTKFDVYNAG